MREATHDRYPRYIVWENVPGAFSTNKGEDFKAVLEAVIGIKEPGAQVPMPEKNLWPYADLYLGEQWSVAYRTLDAQYWGSPQRRRRIYLCRGFCRLVCRTKYYLSPKACQGILRRASVRGKEPPEILRLALERQALMGITAADRFRQPPA